MKKKVFISRINIYKRNIKKTNFFGRKQPYIIIVSLDIFEKPLSLVVLFRNISIFPSDITKFLLDNSFSDSAFIIENNYFCYNIIYI